MWDAFFFFFFKCMLGFFNIFLRLAWLMWSFLISNGVITGGVTHKCTISLWEEGWGSWLNTSLEGKYFSCIDNSFCFHLIKKEEIIIKRYFFRASLITQLVKNTPAMQETLVQFLDQEIPWRRDGLPTPVFLGFPCGSAGKESTCNAGDLGLTPRLGRSPGEGKGNLFQYSGQENLTV